MSMPPSKSRSPISWAPRIARFFGIDVRMHITFPALLVALAWGAYARTGRAQAAVEELIFVVIVFVCVVMHEYGHALTARRFGCETEDITISPIGGIARMKSLPTRPREEMLVAFAGPAVNFVIAGLLMLVLPSTAASLSETMELWQAGNGAVDEYLVRPFRDELLVRLLLVNLLLAIFNLTPAFPMDGGRILRAALATKLDYVRATSIAAGIGKAFALILGLIGLQSSLILVLVAVFIWFGASAEAGSVQTRSLLTGLKVRDAMVTEVSYLRASDPLAVAAQRLLDGHQQDFPVVDGAGAIVGLLRREELIGGLATAGGDATVGRVMLDNPGRVAADDDLATVLADSAGAGMGETLLVMQGPQLVGMFTRDNLSELIMIRSAVTQHGD